MTEQENRILFALIEPEGCWHEWDWKPDDNYTVPNYVCSKCNTRIDEISFPDFTTPEWRIRLQEWLFADEQIKFWNNFTDWYKSFFPEYVVASWSPIPMLIGDIPGYILNYLRTDEAKEKFGRVECPDCGGRGFIGYQGDTREACFTCYGYNNGKIKAPWLIELEK